MSARAPARPRGPCLPQAAYEAVLYEEHRAAGECVLVAWLAERPDSWIRRRIVAVMVRRGR